MAPFIVGIRFQRVGKIYHFDASNVRDLRVGDFAVVETTRGRQLGEVVQLVEHPSPPPEGLWKPIHHRATPRDLVMRQLWQKKELEATINCRAKLAETRIPGVKIVGAEYTFDGSRLSFLYSTESEGKVDLRRLQNAMQRLYPRTRVDMRQMGPRDVAKLLGGMGACGLENRCCSMFLTEFSPISIKMAKEQGISLTPTEITGMCGRLRCCLIYEYEQYVEARKTLPKRNKRVVTPAGEGKVLDTFPLKGSVIVELDTGTRVEVYQQDIQPWDELEALRRKSQAPCDKHEGGECDCGKARTPAAENPAEESFETSDLISSMASGRELPAPQKPQDGVDAAGPTPGVEQAPGAPSGRPAHGQHQRRPEGRRPSRPGEPTRPSEASRPGEPSRPSEPSRSGEDSRSSEPGRRPQAGQPGQPGASRKKSHKPKRKNPGGQGPAENRPPRPADGLNQDRPFPGRSHDSDRNRKKPGPGNNPPPSS